MKTKTIISFSSICQTWCWWKFHWPVSLASTDWLVLWLIPMPQSQGSIYSPCNSALVVQAGGQVLSLLLPDCQLRRAAPPRLLLIENEWLPGGCRVLSKKPLKLQSAWFWCLLGVNLFCLLDGCCSKGGSPINTAHPPLSCYTGEKKTPCELVISLSDRINGSSKVQQAKTTTSLWPWQPS